MLTSYSDDAASAGFCVRLYAYSLDSLIKILLILILRLSLSGSGLYYPGSALSGPVLFNFTLLDIVAYIAGVAYFILFTYLSGATIGKRVFRLKVTKTGDEPVGLSDVIYRETIGRYLSSILCLGYLYAAVNNEKQGLHDILANTRVVYDLKPDYSAPRRTPDSRKPAAGNGAPIRQSFYWTRSEKQLQDTVDPPPNAESPYQDADSALQGAESPRQDAESAPQGAEDSNQSHEESALHDETAFLGAENKLQNVENRLREAENKLQEAESLLQRAESALSDAESQRLIAPDPSAGFDDNSLN